jgi:hypothetical protein
MAVKLTRLTHKIVIQLHIVADSSAICGLSPGSQFGNFWMNPHTLCLYSMNSREVGKSQYGYDSFLQLQVVRAIQYSDWKFGSG